MNGAPPSLNGGFIVVFEGIDGVGKSTQIELAQKALLAEGWPVVLSRNMGGSPIGEALRDVFKAPIERPVATDFYVSVGIQEALVETLEAGRQQHKLVLLDRSPLSLAAYQIYGGIFDESIGWEHVNRGMRQIRPELIIYYSGDIKTAVGRAKRQSGAPDYYDDKPLSFFERVVEGYEVIGKRYPLQVIDADQPIQKVHELTMRRIHEALRGRS